MNLLRKEMWKHYRYKFLKEEQWLERQRLHSVNKDSISWAKGEQLQGEVSDHHLSDTAGWNLLAAAQSQSQAQ